MGGNNGNGKENIINNDFRPDEKKFEKYYEIPQGLFAYPIIIHQKIATTHGIVDAGPGDFVVAIKGKVYLMPHAVFQSKFKKVPPKVKAAVMGFVNEKEEIEIHHTSGI